MNKMACIKEANESLKIYSNRQNIIKDKNLTSENFELQSLSSTRHIHVAFEGQTNSKYYRIAK
jgi:hypothetical protein